MGYIIAFLVVAGTVTIIATIAMLVWQARNPDKTDVEMYAALRSTTKQTLEQAKSVAEAAAQEALQVARSALEKGTQPSDTFGSSTIEPGVPTPVRSLRWLGPAGGIWVQDVHIDSPMAYFINTAAGARSDEPAAVDIALRVDKRAYIPTSRELPYWPRYDQITPGQRGIYLEWLAEGRTRLPPELGYTFLFIYGLERRALVDERDIDLVFDEIVRIREMYAASGQSVSRSLDSYTSSFLWFLVAALPQRIDLERVQRLASGCSLLTEDNLMAVLSWFAICQQPLADWAAFLVAGSLPLSQRSIVASRVNEEFRLLYTRRYTQQFGKGFQLQASKRKKVYSYRPSSAALPAIQVSAAQPLGVPRELQPLSDIWNDCIRDLRKLSLLAAKQTTEELTPTVWEAMPAELRKGIDHPHTDGLYRLVNQNTDGTRDAVITATQAAGVLGLPSPEKLTLGQSRKICETAEYTGYCFEPDARVTGKAYRLDEPLAVFIRTTDLQPEPARYNAAVCMFKIGMMIAVADGHASEDEISVLLHRVETVFHLNENEMRRLEALRWLLTSKGVETGSIRKIARTLTHEQRQAVGKLCLVVVAADGVVTPEEQKAVRSVYADLGFSRYEVDQALQSIGVGEPQEPVTVQQAQEATESGERIPSPPSEKIKVPPRTGLQLNREAIAAIMKDTQEVAVMLAEAMNVETREESDGTSLSVTTEQVVVVEQTATAVLEPPAGLQAELPTRYAAFYQELIGRDCWDRKEADVLARQHRIMLAGAIDALNEWAAERYGGQLFYEDGDNIVIEKSLLS